MIRRITREDVDRVVRLVPTDATETRRGVPVKIMWIGEWGGVWSWMGEFADEKEPGGFPLRLPMSEWRVKE